MRARGVLVSAVSFVLAVVVLAQGSKESKTRGAPKAEASQPVVMPAADLKWTDLDPQGAPGVKVADLWGNHAKGAFGAFFKIPAGFTAPLHTHSLAMKVVIVSGTYIQAPEGKPEFRLGPGSYLMQPGGNYRHTTVCDQTAECLLFVESNGKFDLKPVAEALPAPAQDVAAPHPAPASSSPAAPAQVAGASASKVEDPGGPIAVKATKAGLTRIGAEKCKTCHKIQFTSWAETAHAKRTPPLDCESCHGPGSEYKALAVMKDHEKAKAAGMVIPTATFCKSCHTGDWKDDMLRKTHAHKTPPAS